MSIRKLKAGRKAYYEQSIKNAVCFEVLSGRLSLSEAKATYAIKGDGTIYRWLEEYKKQLAAGNLQSMNSTEPSAENLPSEQKGSAEDLARKNQELQAALEMAKLKITALERKCRNRLTRDKDSSKSPGLAGNYIPVRPGTHTVVSLLI